MIQVNEVFESGFTVTTDLGDNDPPLTMKGPGNHYLK